MIHIATGSAQNTFIPQHQSHSYTHHPYTHHALLRYRLEDVPLGIHLVCPWLPQTNGHMLQQVHHFRHQVFIQQERYDVYSVDQREFDEFDRPNTVHLVKIHGEEVLGMIRLNPTNLPYLLEKEWLHLVDEPNTLPHSSHVWEASRLAVIKSLDTRLRQRIRFELRLAMLEYALQVGVTEYIALSFPVIWQTLKSLGWPTELLGRADRLPNGAIVQVAKAVLNHDILSLVRRLSGIHSPVLINASTRSGGVSCH